MPISDLNVAISMESLRLSEVETILYLCIKFIKGILLAVKSQTHFSDETPKSGV